MAITIYKNHIPPSIEHLVWGGRKELLLDILEVIQELRYA